MRSHARQAVRPESTVSNAMTVPAASPTFDVPLSAQRAPLVALLLRDLNCGGPHRMAFILAEALADRGARIDLVVCDARGNLRSEVPPCARLVSLDRANSLSARLAALRADLRGIPALAKLLLQLRRGLRTLPYLPALGAYLRNARPDALLAATPHLNIEAVLARRLAGASTRIVVSERNNLSEGKPGRARRSRRLSAAIRRTYLQADGIVAVSNGVAADLARTTGIPRQAITTIYNPAITPDFPAKLAEPVDHPWFTEDAVVPVVLGVGRLGPQKDFVTLLRAFARVRRERPARLVIIGDVRGHESDRDHRLAGLYRLAADLGVRDDFELLGYQPNPFRYMARAAVFALSSRFEGFGNVLLEALACGTPVVSTDCPSGPAEILDGGAYGALVPVGDDVAMAAAIGAALEHPSDPAHLRARAAMFDFETTIARYEALLLGRACSVLGPHQQP
jgi:glycosyltransferase involved in cell wall biosynthesis